MSDHVTVLGGVGEAVIFPLQFPVFTGLFVPGLSSHDWRLTTHRSGENRVDHIWIMVDQDGAQTLFQLVEVGAASDASRLVKELHLPVVMIDVAHRVAAPFFTRSASLPLVAPHLSTRT
jgi:hypothetical protein